MKKVDIDEEYKEENKVTTLFKKVFTLGIADGSYTTKYRKKTI
jgi:hypothetical protein